MRKYVFCLCLYFLFVGLSGYGYCNDGRDDKATVAYLSNTKVDSGEKNYVKTFFGEGTTEARKAQQEMEQFINSGLYEIVAVKTDHDVVAVFGHGPRYYFAAEVYYRTKTSEKTSSSVK